MTKIFLSIRYKYNGKSFIDLSQNQKNTKRKIISDFNEGILKWENQNETIVLFNKGKNSNI